MKSKFVIIGVIIVALLYGLFSVFSKNISDETLPIYARQNPMIEESYMLALSNPEVLNAVKCYCGCMQRLHSGRLHIRGLLDCFIKEDGSFEKHGSECNMCINDALNTKKWNKEGLSKEEINERIEMKYLNVH